MDNGRTDACRDRSAAAAANSGGGGAAAAPARPHWRHRDRSATAVYVVHPAQFRTVVQQLTGATTSPQQESVHGSAGGGGNASFCSADGANAPARKSDVHERRTLAQLHHDCMAWADDH